MSFFGWARRCAIFVALCLCLSGCLPSADNPSDETREPHFMAGKNLVEQMDWQGAVDEFQKSLEVNPHSASAHFELGWLSEEKLNDPAAAIYHYQQYLAYAGNQDKADLVKQRVNTCKMELVKTVSAVGPSQSGAQREMDRLSAENRDLQNQVTQLQAQIAQLKAAATAVVSRPQPPVVDMGSSPVTHVTGSINPVQPPENHSTRDTGSKRVSTHSTSRASKFHVVRSHETMASIARQYGISLAALEDANPQIRPSHLEVGQALKVPAP